MTNDASSCFELSGERESTLHPCGGFHERKRYENGSLPRVLCEHELTSNELMYGNLLWKSIVFSRLTPC